ncbi:MAG TPA: hypothetical protein VIU65_06085, partial [Pyrinomonadaceae bacterium]
IFGNDPKKSNCVKGILGFTDLRFSTIITRRNHYPSLRVGQFEVEEIPPANRHPILECVLNVHPGDEPKTICFKENLR